MANNDNPPWPDDWPVQRHPPDLPDKPLAPGESLRKLAGCDIHLPRSVSTRSSNAQQHLLILPGILSLPKKAPSSTTIGKIKGLTSECTDISLQLGESLALTGKPIPTKSTFLALSIKNKNKITVKAVLSSVYVFGEARRLRETTTGDKQGANTGMFHHSGVSIRADDKKRSSTSRLQSSPAKKTKKSKTSLDSESSDDDTASFASASGVELGTPSPQRRSSRQARKSISLAEDSSAEDASDPYGSSDDNEEYAVETHRSKSKTSSTPRIVSRIDDPPDGTNLKISRSCASKIAQETESSTEAITPNALLTNKTLPQSDDVPSNEDEVSIASSSDDADVESELSVSTSLTPRRTSSRSRTVAMLQEDNGTGSNVASSPPKMAEDDVSTPERKKRRPQSTVVKPTSARNNVSPVVDHEEDESGSARAATTLAQQLGEDTADEVKHDSIQGISFSPSKRQITRKPVPSHKGDSAERSLPEKFVSPKDATWDQQKKVRSTKSVLETATSVSQDQTPSPATPQSRKRRRRRSPDGKRPKSGIWDAVDESDFVFAKF